MNKCTLMLRVKMVSGVYVFNREMCSLHLRIYSLLNVKHTVTLLYANGVDSVPFEIASFFCYTENGRQMKQAKNIVLHFRVH